VKKEVALEIARLEAARKLPAIVMTNPFSELGVTWPAVSGQTVVRLIKTCTLDKMIYTAFGDYNHILCQALANILDSKIRANKHTFGERTIYNYLDTRLAGRPIYHPSYEMQHLTLHTAKDFRNQLRLLPDNLKCPLVTRIIAELCHRVGVPRPKGHSRMYTTERKPCGHSRARGPRSSLEVFT